MYCIINKNLQSNIVKLAIKKMGGKQTRTTKSPQILGTSYEDEHYFDQVIQTDECCGFVRHRTVKKIERLVWEDNFMMNCQDLQMYYEWVHDVQECVKLNSRKMPRKKFVQQFNSLKFQGSLQPSAQKQILLSPSEIDQFKINLKNSVLLSYGQAVKPPRPKQNSKIETIMFSANIKQEGKNINYTPSFAKSERKRSDMLKGSEVRKQSILKERQRTLRQSFSKTGFRDSLMSFVDDTMASLFRGQQKQISKISAQALQIFVKFSLILQKHLNDKQNIICKIIQSFQSYIYKKYTIFNSTATTARNSLNDEYQISEKQKEILQLSQLEQKIKNKVKKDRFKKLQNRKNLTTEQLQELTTDIKMFLLLLRQIVEDYYKTTQFIYNDGESKSLNEQNIQDSSFYGANTNFLITNEDNILILVTAILFKNQKFYTHIFNIFKKYNEEKQKNFKKILSSLNGKQPEYFQVKRDYCLNQYTIDKFISQQDKNKQNQDKIKKNNDSQTKQKQQDKQTKQVNRMSLIDRAVSKGVSTQTILTFNAGKSYTKCAEALQKLTKSKTPTTKMKNIMQCSQKITQSVAQFYNIYNIQLKNQMLDADQILSIFCYILSLNSVQNIHSHLFMIQHFATENQMISVTGYYYSVLTCALEQLENMYSSTVADISFDKNQSMMSTNNNNRNPSKSKSFGNSPNKTKKDKLKRSFRKN